MDNSKKSILSAKIKTLSSYDKESINTISEYKTTYNIYKDLPKIIFILIGIFGFLTGVSVGIMLEHFLAFFLILLASAIIGAVIFFILKITCSEKILNLEYTRRVLYALKINNLENKLREIEKEEAKEESTK